MNADPKLSPEEYRKILSGVELKDVYLKESKSFVNREQASLAEMRIDIEEASSFELGEKNTVLVEHTYKLDARKPKTKTRALQIDAGYVLVLSSVETFSAEFFEIYKELTVPLIVWPFFREFANSTTSRMGIPPLTLPLIKR